MNYEKHYKLLCQTRQQLNRQKLPASHPDYVYYELHHIIPKHENGSDEASNLVLLTAREHFIAHWLFAKWKRTQKAWHALSAMRLEKASYSRKLNSKQYEICKIAQGIAQSSRVGSANSFYGKTHSITTKKLLRAKNTGKKYSKAINKKKGRSGLKAPCSEATKLKLSLANKNKLKEPASAETKAKISKALKGKHKPQKYKASMLAKTCYRLNQYGPVCVMHKKHGAILLTDAKCMLSFCQQAKIELRCLERVINKICKSTKGWQIIS